MAIKNQRKKALETIQEFITVLELDVEYGLRLTSDSLR